jgi:hypothetical protein
MIVVLPAAADFGQCGQTFNLNQHKTNVRREYVSGLGSINPLEVIGGGKQR